MYGRNDIQDPYFQINMGKGKISEYLFLPFNLHSLSQQEEREIYPPHFFIDPQQARLFKIDRQNIYQPLCPEKFCRGTQ